MPNKSHYCHKKLNRSIICNLNELNNTTTPAPFFDGVDFAIVFPSMLAPVIIMVVMSLITLVVVVAGVVALVAAVKIVAPTTIAAVVVVVWGVVGARNPCCFFDNYLFSVVGIRIFLSGV